MVKLTTSSGESSLSRPSFTVLVTVLLYWSWCTTRSQYCSMSWEWKLKLDLLSVFKASQVGRFVCITLTNACLMIWYLIYLYIYLFPVKKNLRVKQLWASSTEINQHQNQAGNFSDDGWRVLVLTVLWFVLSDEKRCSLKRITLFCFYLIIHVFEDVSLETVKCF